MNINNMIQSEKLRAELETYTTYNVVVPFYKIKGTEELANLTKIHATEYIKTNLILTVGKEGKVTVHIPYNTKINLENTPIICPNYEKKYEEIFEKIMGRPFTENESNSLLKDLTITQKGTEKVQAKNGVILQDTVYTVSNEMIKEFSANHSTEYMEELDYLTCVKLKEGEQIVILDVYMPNKTYDTGSTNFGLFISDVYHYDLKGDSYEFELLNVKKDGEKITKIITNLPEALDPCASYIAIKHNIVQNTKNTF